MQAQELRPQWNIFGHVGQAPAFLCTGHISFGVEQHLDAPTLQFLVDFGSGGYLTPLRKHETLDDIHRIAAHSTSGSESTQAGAVATYTESHKRPRAWRGGGSSPTITTNDRSTFLCRRVNWRETLTTAASFCATDKRADRRQRRFTMLVLRTGASRSKHRDGRKKHDACHLITSGCLRVAHALCSLSCFE